MKLKITFTINLNFVYFIRNDMQSCTVGFIR